MHIWSAISYHNMASRRRLLKATAVAGTTGLAGCLGGILGGGGGGETIEIGFNTPLTGFAAADGKSAKRGAVLAKENINSDGGVNGHKIELYIADDAASAAQAIPVAKKFIHDKHVDIGISGSYSSPTRAIAPIYNQNDVPFISAYATHPSITNGKYTFRVGIWAPIHGKVGAKIADEKLGTKSAAVFIMNNAFGTTVANQFIKSAKDRGIDIIYKTTYPVGESNFRSALSSVKNNNPDLLYATGYYHEMASIVTQAEQLGLDVRIMGDEGCDSPKFFDLGGKATNGTIISTNLNRGPERGLSTETFIKQYEERWGMGASMVSANCFDAVQLAAKAVRKAGGTDPQKIVQAIKALSSWKEAVTGPVYEFIGPGEAVRPIAVQEVKNVQWTEFATVRDKQIIRPDV